MPAHIFEANLSFNPPKLKKIGLLSDTHGWLDKNIAAHFADCDEVWHAGDFGDAGLVEDLSQELQRASKGKQIPIRGVYGNIDGNDLRSLFPEQLVFECENVKVMMRHIGGAPPRYNPETRKELELHRPLLFIAGHSHILKVMFDEKTGCLHINPGAAGRQGWHKVRTIVTLTIDGSNMKDCKVIELGSRSSAIV